MKYERRFRAVLFDLGETLYMYKGIPLSWKEHYTAAWQQALLAVDLDAAELDLHAVGEYMLQYNTRVVPRELEYGHEAIFGGALDLLRVDRRHVNVIADSYFAYFRQSISPYPEATTVLRALQSEGIRLGALTDVAYGMPERFVRDDLERSGLDEFIDEWRTSVQIGFRKPRPEGFLALCVALNVASTHAIYVGNEEKDIVGASAAGIAAALVFRGSGQPPDWGQQFTIRCLDGCLDLVSS